MGGIIPVIVLCTMLLNMLPEEVAKEIRDRRQTRNTTQRALDYLPGGIVRVQRRLHQQAPREVSPPTTFRRSLQLSERGDGEH